jgi:hypothetical protein
MRRFFFISIAGLLSLTACSDQRKPSDANFTKAINQYLAKHGQACTVIGREFPVDVPKSEQRLQAGAALQMAALEQAGLVHSSDTTAVVYGMLDPLRNAASSQPVKRYELTDQGRRYFRQVPSALGQTGSFCYGQKAVDSIVKWTEPMTMGTSSQTEVTYTYKIVDPASWANNEDVRSTFPDVRTTVVGASRTTPSRSAFGRVRHAH